MDNSKKSLWQKWIKREHIIPYATIAGALTAPILAFLGYLKLSIPEGIILTLLALLAADALVERMGILEQIQHGLELINRPEQDEPQLMLQQGIFYNESFEEYLQGASELFVSGGSLVGLLKEQFNVLDKWLAITSKAKLKLILVNPQLVREGKISAASLYRDANEGQELFAQDIDRALIQIASLQKKHSSKIEFYLTKETPSVTVLMVDKNKAIISINLYKGYPDERPSFTLSKKKHPIWFDVFEKRYYKELWTESHPK